MEPEFKAFLVKCGLSAIGRALATCGYGAQFAPDMDEEHRLADAPISPVKQTVVTPVVTPKQDVK